MSVSKGDEVYLKAFVENVTVGSDWIQVRLHGRHGHLETTHTSEVVIPTERDATFRVGADAPATSKAVEAKIRDGSLQAELLAMFETEPARLLGWTDDELERWTARSHQSVSACRNTLVRKGLVEASAETRKTRSGNEAIVWRRSPVEVAQ